MADFNTSSRAPFGAIAAYGFVQFAARLREKIAAWRNAHVTRVALNRLSDRELADIGLTRADIDAVAGSRWR
jgi:uncharacterized protein YjiS (DUF1127 family)